MADCISVGDVDEVRDRVETGFCPDIAKADGTKVGGFAGNDGADFVVQAEGGGAVQCGHAQDFTGRQGGGVARCSFGK